MCPLKKINISQKKKPWLSTELLEYLVDKNNYLAIAKRTITTEDTALARFHRNEAKRLTKLAQQQYYTDRVRRYENNTKKFWKTIHEIIPSNTKENTTLNLINETTTKQIPDTEVTNYINTYFAEIGPKLATKLTTRGPMMAKNMNKGLPSAL